MPKYLGQHFLKNTDVVGQIIASVQPEKGDLIVEIGPGQGALTIPLVETAAKNGAKVVAIEKDERLIKLLNEKLVSAISPEIAIEKTLEIVHGDALKILSDQITGVRNTKFVGNIPYYITGHLLRIVGDLNKKPERCVFMVQKEVAERIIAKPPKMNRLAASVQYWSKPKIIARLGKNDFSPPPEVDSAVILLETSQNIGPDAREYYSAVTALFAQPRKTLINNLFDALKTISPKISKEEIVSTLQTLGIQPTLRPQNLNIDDIKRIAVHFFKKIT